MKKLTIEEMHRLSAEAFHEARKLPLVAVLDNVRSQHNVGAVFRTADAFLIEAVYLCGISPKPDTLAANNDLHKTALGAEQTVAWRAFENTMDAVCDLKSKGYLVLSVEQAHGSIPPEQVVETLQQEDMKGVAVVLGHEVFGVAQEVVDASDGCVEIPQYGTKHSLNVSVTAGIVLYSLATAMRNRVR